MKKSLEFLSIEQKLIEDIKNWTGEGFIGDDCAVLPGQLLVTSDMLVEGTHFTLEKIKYDLLGWKAIAVNLSDIAAMAGYPRYALASISFPDTISYENKRKLFQGMIYCAGNYRTRLVGGDLTHSELLTISITVIGDANECGVMKRSGAKPGDVVIASGDFGASAAGLFLLQNEISGYQHCYQKHTRPLPRLSESWALAKHASCQGALMDASDGLADSLAQICRASNVGMKIDYSKIPVHDETKAIADLSETKLFDWVFYGGEDYELVACLPQEKWKELKEFLPSSFVAIGEVNASQAITVVNFQSEETELDLSKAFQHWK